MSKIFNKIFNKINTIYPNLLKDRTRKSLFNTKFFNFSIFGWCKWVFMIIVKVIFFYNLFGTLFVTPKVFSPSMTPTLETNDFILMSTSVYKLKVPFLKNITLCNISKPKIGDIVGFTSKPYSENMTFTKRILAGPGDKIQYKNGILFINDKIVKLKYIKQYKFIENNKEYDGMLYEETLPNGNKHFVLYNNKFGEYYNAEDTTEPFILGDKEYFCGGDNRHNSDDSRTSIGIIPEDQIIGKGILILFSNGNITTFEITSFIKGIKWNRCLTWLV